MPELQPYVLMSAAGTGGGGSPQDIADRAKNVCNEWAE